MTDQRKARRDALFVDLIRLPPSERADLLDRKCGSDAALRQEIEDLLRHDAAMPAAFLEGVRTEGPSWIDVAGRAIGPYALVRELGRGGQGIVYLAKDTRLPRQVALKVLESGPLASNEPLRRFHREAAVASRLEHPGICGIHDAGVHEGLAYIAMRYVEGETLARKIAAARGDGAEPPSSSCVALHSGLEALPPDALAVHATPTTSKSLTRTRVMLVVRMFERAARALHAAHEAGIIHRDIKPGNIMVTPEEEPVILDFGLADDAGDDQPTLTRSGEIFGTPGYMSPEQLTRQSIRLDRRTDVYSLGVALYESLTLRRPFDAPTREGLYQAILTKDPPDARRLNPAIPTDLRVILQTAMEKDRDRRYQTAASLADDLCALREGRPIAARPIGPVGRFIRWSRRKPQLATALACLVIAFAVSLYLLVEALRQAERADKNASAKNLALGERQTALDEYQRLGDVSRLSQLVAEADELWPPSPGNVARYVAWLLRAEQLAASLPGHRDTVERLRAFAIPAPPSRPATLGSELSSKPVSPTASYRFADVAVQFKHDTLAKLVDDLRAFVDPDPRKGLVADVRKRLAFAEAVERESIGKHEAAWANATRSIGDRTECPAYDRLTITPQLGLIPIGKDPASGLWEFVDVHTTAPGTDPVPKRDAGGRLLVTESMGLVFVLLPGGTFTMGALKPEEDQAPTEPNVDPEALDNEYPVKDIVLDPFFMSKYEMTQGQWVRLVGQNPSGYGPGTNFGGKFVDLRNPVEKVSWDDCNCWLVRQGMMLPTEAQWEYAARGGTRTPRWTGIGTDGLANAANLLDQFLRHHGGHENLRYESWDDGFTVHAPVGSLAPNQFGLHDVLGNVSEWCRDMYDWGERHDVAARPGDGLRCPPGARTMVARGGFFGDVASRARSSSRDSSGPTTRADSIGVRPARRLEP